MWTTTTNTPQQTMELGYRLGKLLHPPTLVALTGDLGAGKTCLAQGILRGIGIAEMYLVSPSYILVQEYTESRSNTRIYHMDLYRLESSRQIDDLGVEEYFDSHAIGIIEWADRLGQMLPDARLEIKLTASSDLKRQIQFTPYGLNYENIVSQLASPA